MFEGIVWLDLVETGSIDEAEQEVAKFGFHLLFVHVVDLCLELVDLFLDLLPHILALLPVEASVASLILDSVGLDQSRQARRNAAEDRLVAVFLFLLHYLPELRHLVSIAYFHAIACAHFADQ